jgi:ribonuclease HII
MIVGIDEAGRGPLAGAVVACALYLAKEPDFAVKDSKALSASSRQKIFAWLIKNSDFCVKIATVKEIDKFNILEATFLAFNRCIEELLKKLPSLRNATFIIDGNLFRTKLDVNYKCIEKADQKIKEVACASIIAKVTRDYLMHLADFLYPQWNFVQHKGYPTKEHFSLLSEQRPSPIHRRSFYPVSQRL